LGFPPTAEITTGPSPALSLPSLFFPILPSTSYSKVLFFEDTVRLREENVLASCFSLLCASLSTIIPVCHLDNIQNRKKFKTSETIEKMNA
jgi:hypothetical protein